MQVLYWMTFLLVVATGSQCYHPLKQIFSWGQLEFAYPTPQDRQKAIESGEFIPGGLTPIDVEVHNRGRKPVVFITIPRFQPGVPVTLGTVTDNVTSEGNPLIEPYPNWEMNKIGNCDNIISVFRVKKDECGRLWVLDTGKVGDNQICSPQLHLFSLHTNKRINLYKFPKRMYVDTSLFITPTVDIRNGMCEDAFVYIADSNGFGIIVYDHRRQRSWRIMNNLVYPYPQHGTYTIRGQSFDLMDGILGMALSPIKQDGDRVLYFHPLASTVEAHVLTSVIRNESIFEHNVEAMPRAFVPFPIERPSQSAAEVMDRNGVLFYGLLSETAIACWNSQQYPEYGGRNSEVVLYNPDTLQFPSGMKIVTMENDEDVLWLMTISFQKFMTGTLNPRQTNFRIQAGYVHEIVRGTKCDARPFRRRSSA